MTVPMNIKLTGRDRKGLIFIHAMTLCSDQEALRNIALTDSHQAYTGVGKNNQKPCQMPRINYG